MKSRLETIYYTTDDVKIEYYVEPDGIKIKSVECNLPYSSIVLPVSINGVNVVTLLMGFAEKLCAEGLYLPPVTISIVGKSITNQLWFTRTHF